MIFKSLNELKLLPTNRNMQSYKNDNSNREIIEKNI